MPLAEGLHEFEAVEQFVCTSRPIIRLENDIAVHPDDITTAIR